MTTAFSLAISPFLYTPTSSGVSFLVIQNKLHILPPLCWLLPSSFHWYLLCFLRVSILKRDHVNILLQPAACQRLRRPRQWRASSGSAVLGCVFPSTRQKIHVITSEAQEAVPPDRTACVGSTLSGLHWLIPHSTQGCVCVCMCVCIGVSEFGHTCVCKTYQQAHQYSAPRLQSLPDLLIISILLHPNSEEIQYLEVPHESLTTGQDTVFPCPGMAAMPEGTQCCCSEAEENTVPEAHQLQWSSRLRHPLSGGNQTLPRQSPPISPNTIALGPLAHACWPGGPLAHARWPGSPLGFRLQINPIPEETQA